MPNKRRSGYTVCTVAGCPELTHGGRCDTHRAEAEKARGTARQRGYGHGHRSRFRPAVLTKNPKCVCTNPDCGHPQPCGAVSVHADHYPLDRRELLRRQLDPDDPQYGRGLCGPCHSRHTATEQPGGWNR